MKKFLVVLVSCVLITVLVYSIRDIPSVKNVASDVKSFVLAKKTPEYTNDFNINKLRVKNQINYYNHLTDAQKIIYANLAQGVKDLDNNIELVGYEMIDGDTTMSDCEKAMKAFTSDHPEVFYLLPNYTVSTKQSVIDTYVELEMNYSVTSISELNSQIDEIDSKVSQYINTIKVKSGYEAELELHDLLGINAQYYDYTNVDDIPEICHTAYGALINNQCVCDGYTRAMQLLLDRVNIESILVYGMLEGEAHAWNMVKLEDEWYNLDLTSNKSIKQLNNKAVLHSYFNVTNDTIQRTHSFKDVTLVPEAVATRYNYFEQSGKIVNNSLTFNEQLKSLIEKNDNPYVLEFRADNISGVPEKMVNVLSINQFKDYVSDGRIRYFNILDTYVLARN